MSNFSIALTAEKYYKQVVENKYSFPAVMKENVGYIGRDEVMENTAMKNCNVLKHSKCFFSKKKAEDILSNW